MAFVKTSFKSIDGVDYASERDVIVNEQYVVSTFPGSGGVYGATLDIVDRMVYIESTDLYWYTAPASVETTTGRVQLDVLDINGVTYEQADYFDMDKIIWAFEGADGYARIRYQSRTIKRVDEYKIDSDLSTLFSNLSTATYGAVSFPIGGDVSGAMDKGILYTNGTALEQSPNLLWDYDNDQLVMASYGTLSITGTTSSIAGFTVDGEMIEVDPASLGGSDDLDDVMARGTTLSANYVIDTDDHHYTINSGTAEIRLYGITRVDANAEINFYVGTSNRNRIIFNNPDKNGSSPIGTGPSNETGMMYQFSDGGIYSDPDLGRTTLILTEYGVSSMFIGIDGADAVIGPQGTSDFYIRRDMDYESSNIIGSGTDVMKVTKSTGQVTWPEYGSGSTLTGAVTGYLGVNASGEMKRVSATSIGGGSGDNRDALMLMGG